jgi:hypothetical protein
MSQELISIIQSIKNKITDTSDMSWTYYNSAQELRNELDAYISQLDQGKTEALEKLNFLFAPTGTLQEHSISNNWSEEYLTLSGKFDNIYESGKSRRTK